MSINLEVVLFYDSVYVSIHLLSLFSSNVSFSRLLSIIIQLKLSLSRNFEKVNLYPFHRGKVDNLFVLVGGNCMSWVCLRGVI